MMADTNELLDRETLLSIDQHSPGIGDGYESPGTRKLHDSKTTRSATEESEVSGKLVERPISSGSTGLIGFTYGAAPKRNLHIHRKARAAPYPSPYPAPNPIRADNGERSVAKQADDQVNYSRRSGIASSVGALIADRMFVAQSTATLVESTAMEALQTACRIRSSVHPTMGELHRQMTWRGIRRTNRLKYALTISHVPLQPRGNLHLQICRAIL